MTDQLDAFIQSDVLIIDYQKNDPARFSTQLK